VYNHITTLKCCTTSLISATLFLLSISVFALCFIRLSTEACRSSSASTTCTCYRVVTQQRSGSSLSTSTELLKQLRWLPIEWGIRFKLVTNLQRIAYRLSAIYLADLLRYRKTTKSTRSSASHLLSVPRHNLSFGSRTFCISAPKDMELLTPYLLTFCNLKLLILLGVI